MLRILRFTFVVLLLALSAGKLSAVTLDWDTVTWAPGSLSNSYNIDPLKAGNDITLTLSGDTAQFAPKGGSNIPAVLNIIEGGLSPVQNSLVLHVDLLNTSQAVQMSVDFSALYNYGVNNVSFTLFDVDIASGAFQDQIRSIQALSIDGVTLIAPTITVGSAATLSGSGINQVVTGTTNNPDTGAGSGAGNVTISFGTAAIKSFVFTYGSGATAPADPTSQGISMHDLSYTPIPEINPGWSAILSCFAVSALIFRHRASLRK